MKRSRKFGLHKVTEWFLLLLIFCVLLVYIYNSLHRYFDHDEFQHIHTAWCMKHGQLIYKDFFDHHGILFPIFNVSIWHAFNLPEEFDTLFIFRIPSLIFICLTCLLTYLISRTFSSRLTALFSVLLVLINCNFITKAIEIRPDLMQITFWLWGIYLLLGIAKNDYPKHAKLQFFFAGSVLSMALLANLKTILPLAILLMAYFCIHKSLFRIKHIACFAIGLVLPFIPIMLYYYFHQGFYELFYGNIMYNLLALPHNGYRLFHLFSENQALDIVLFIFYSIGCYLLFRNSSSTKNSRLIGILSLGLMLTAFLGIHRQWYLFFIPLISIVAATGIMHRTEYLPSSAKNLLVIFGSIALLLLARPQYQTLKSEKLQGQRTFTNYIMANSISSDYVLLGWNDYGGYMFRQHPGYYFFLNQNHVAVFEVLFGKETFAHSLLNHFKLHAPIFIVADEEELKVFSWDINRWIHNNYTRSSVYPYLLIKKTSAIKK